MPKATQASQVRTFTDIPNIGKAMAGDFPMIGIARPEEIAGQDPYDMYERLCSATNTRQDPCVLDVFIAVVRFMEGGPVLPWWHYTEERKRRKE
jgi:hypothetical protein